MNLQDYVGLWQHLLPNGYDNARSAQWEETHAQALRSIANIVEEALCSLDDGEFAADVHKALLDNIRAERGGSPRVATLLDTTSALDELLTRPMGSAETFTNTLRVLWVCIQTHDELTIAYTEELPRAAGTPLHSGAQKRHLTRQWMATNYTALLELGQYVRALNAAIRTGSITEARTLAVQLLPGLSPDALSLMNDTPFLRELIELPADDAQAMDTIRDFVGHMPL